MVWDFEYRGLNAIVSDSHAAVLARVESVSEARWNSEDGLQWESDPTNPEISALPMEYRDAVVIVERTLYSSAKLAVEDSERIELRLWGSGQATRGPVGDLSPPLQFDEISGRVAPGDLRVFILERAEFPMENGATPVIRISNHFQGTWRVVNGSAESVDVRRNVSSLDLLTTALVRERTLGRDMQRDEKTRLHPLGEPR
jgi:hypothetical protein